MGYQITWIKYELRLDLYLDSLIMKSLRSSSSVLPCTLSITDFLSVVLLPAHDLNVSAIVAASFHVRLSAIVEGEYEQIIFCNWLIILTIYNCLIVLTNNISSSQLCYGTIFWYTSEQLCSNIGDRKEETNK